MKIQVVSDLHHEFGISYQDIDDIDVFVVAGDLDTGTRGVRFLMEIADDIPVVYVLGNHEYYGGAYPKTLYEIKAMAEGSNIHVLENESVIINDVTFHGATLWTDFELFGDPRYFGSMCQERMNDYKRIKLSPLYSKFRTIDTYNIHKESLRWLEKSLQQSETAANIVVTHHAPSMKSIPLQLREDFISSAYASNLEAFIQEHQPEYWIHGHIHQPVQYMIGKSIIICNPHGYITEKHTGYDPKLIINLKDL